MIAQPSRRFPLLVLLLLTAGAARLHATPPVIPIQPVSTNIAIGDTLNLFVVATPPPFTYQWRLNGANLEGKTNASITIPAVGTGDFGSYHVIVRNPAGVTSSDPALVLLNTLPTPPSGIPNDNFNDSYNITALSSPIHSSNAGATRQLAEPEHAGKYGSNSVWYSWTAPASGILEIATRGSCFDTLLAAYTGNLSSGLAEAASDDDRGGFFTSRIRFNAVSGTTYHIAVDSLGLAGGPFILAWSFTVSPVQLPIVTSQPVSRSVLAGSTTILSVTVSASTPTYQWFFNGQPLAGATASSLTITNVQRDDVGDYYCHIEDGLRSEADSLPATLEIGSVPRTFSFDKILDFRDVVFRAGGGGGGGGGDAGAALGAVGDYSAGAGPVQAAAGAGGGIGLAPGFVPVGIGGLGQQILNNTNSNVESGSCLSCGVTDNASRWFGIQPEHDGLLTLDTIGSDVSTVLAVYLDVNPLQFCNSLQACDTNGAPNGTNSQVSFLVSAQTSYIVGIDSQSAMEGIIHLNYRLCERVPPFHLNDTQIVLQATPPAEQNFDYHWRENGAAIATTTEPTLAIAPLSNNARNYSLTISNDSITVVTNLGHLLQLDHDHSLDKHLFQILMTGVAGLNYQIEAASPHLTNCAGNWLWLPIGSPIGVPAGQTISFEFPMNEPQRYFRVRPAP